MVDPGAFTPFYDDALCRALAGEDCDVRLVTAPFVYHPWPEAVGYARRELFAERLQARNRRMAGTAGDLVFAGEGGNRPGVIGEGDRKQNGHR